MITICEEQIKLKLKKPAPKPNLPGIFLIRCKTTAKMNIGYSKLSVAIYIYNMSQGFSRGKKDLDKMEPRYLADHLRRNSIDIENENTEFYDLFEAYVVENCNAKEFCSRRIQETRL